MATGDGKTSNSLHNLSHNWRLFLQFIRTTKLAECSISRHRTSCCGASTFNMNHNTAGRRCPVLLNPTTSYHHEDCNPSHSRRLCRCLRTLYFTSIVIPTAISPCSCHGRCGKVSSRRSRTDSQGHHGQLARGRFGH